MVMNKPPVNSLNLEFLDEIKIQLNKLKNDKIRGMILTSVCIGFYFIFLLKTNIYNVYKINKIK